MKKEHEEILVNLVFLIFICIATLLIQFYCGVAEIQQSY